MIRKIVVIISLIYSGLTFGQSIKDSSIFTPLVSVSYGFQIPAGDLKDRFGWNNSIGFNVNFKTASNWVFGAEGQFIFGNNVKDTSALRDLKTEDGQIINSEGEFSRVLAFERGWKFYGNIGKVFPVIGPNKNSGILFKLGLGYWQHKAKFDSEQDLVPQLTAQYKTLYDGFSNGLMTTQFLGYLHQSNSKLANFYAGFEFSQGYTEVKRTAQAGGFIGVGEKRLDLDYGLKFGWIVPIRSKNSTGYHFD